MPYSDAHDCYFFDDILLMALVVAFGSVPMLFIARSLIHVFDAFRIRQEMERVIGISSLLCGEWVGSTASYQDIGGGVPRFFLLSQGVLWLGGPCFE